MLERSVFAPRSHFKSYFSNAFSVQQLASPRILENLKRLLTYRVQKLIFQHLKLKLICFKVIGFNKQSSFSTNPKRFAHGFKSSYKSAELVKTMDFFGKFFSFFKHELLCLPKREKHQANNQSVLSVFIFCNYSEDLTPCCRDSTPCRPKGSPF